jgi:hypothetical protein
MGALDICRVQGDIQIQFSLGASTGIGGAATWTGLKSDLDEPGQLAGRGGGFGGSGGVASVVGIDRTYSSAGGRTINTFAATVGVGIVDSPEFAGALVEGHAFGSYTLDIGAGIDTFLGLDSWWNPGGNQSGGGGSF